MPHVAVAWEIDAPRRAVWDAIVDVESYPDCMETVRRTSIVRQQGDDERTVFFSVLLKGAILEWEERERLDEAAGTVRFEQESGDLSELDGSWTIAGSDEGPVRVVLDVRFDIGIPQIAMVLNPVAARALEENSRHMLRDLERRVEGSA